jgi:Mrp family chromosome partitioning ATPase
MRGMVTLPTLRAGNSTQLPQAVELSELFVKAIQLSIPSSTNSLYAAGPGRKYFMLGGKGGVGKTSCSSSLGVKCALDGHTTLVVSTDPAHSLSDSLDQVRQGGEGCGSS